MNLVYGPQPVLKAFIEAHIPRITRLSEPGFGIGVIDTSDKLVGGFWYHDFDAKAGVLEISGAASNKRWLSRKVLHGLFSHPFDALGCQMVAMRHSANDKALARMLKAYGFHQVTIPRLFGRHEDGIVSTLTDDAWRSNKFHSEV